MDTIALIIIAICGFFLITVRLVFTLSIIKNAEKKVTGGKMSWQERLSLVVLGIVCLFIIVHGIFF